MAQLLPLPLTVSCFSKVHVGFAFLVPAHLGSPGQRAVKRVCVSAGLMPTEAVRGNYLPEDTYLRETKTYLKL